MQNPSRRRRQQPQQTQPVTFNTTVNEALTAGRVRRRTISEHTPRRGLLNKLGTLWKGLSRSLQALVAVSLLAIATVALYGTLRVSYRSLPLPESRTTLTANGMVSMLGTVSNMTMQLVPAALTVSKGVVIALVEEVDSMKAWAPELSLGQAVGWSVAKQAVLYISVGGGGALAIPRLTGQHANAGLLISIAAAVASASATLTKGMKEIKLSSSTTRRIHLGAMAVLGVLSWALLRKRAHGQLAMDWVLDHIFSVKLGGKMSGVLAKFWKEPESASPRDAEAQRRSAPASLPALRVPIAELATHVGVNRELVAYYGQLMGEDFGGDIDPYGDLLDFVAELESGID